jgi:signal recognition particle subunit SRP54
VFDALSEKLQTTLADVRGHGTLTEADIDKAMRDIRLALLEADVNFKVVKSFTATVKERCLGADVLGTLNPGQQVVKIVNEELAALMGGASRGVTFSPRPPTVIVLAGLQGSGKTTAAAKLARWLKSEHGSSVALAACDVYRPAAVDQLVKVGAQVGADVYEQGTDRDPVDIARWALDRAKIEGKDVLIVDTSGRLHVDEALMAELVRIRDAVKPHSILLVVDAMTGQDAVNVAEQFAAAVQFDGVVMSKLDGDARGGAALSVKAVTGKPILFASVGEKLDQFERFHPDRMAQRILGMGDVMSLIEKAEAQIEEDEAKELERKMRRNEFTLEDFLKQLKTVRRMGPLQSIMGMIPGLAGNQLANMKVDERELDRVEAIILSMTPEERRRPELIKGSRRLRIAKGSGTNVQAVNQLVKQFDQMRKLMRQIGRGKMPDIGALMRGGRGGLAPATLSRRLFQALREELPLAVRLRLTRVGGKKDPIWRVVVADQRSPRDGRFIENVGQYNPQTDPSTINLDEDRVRAWLAKGAQPTETVRKLLKIKGIDPNAR